jgi:hypothetical protein
LITATYDDTVLAYFDVVPNLRRLDDRVRTNVNVVADFHGVVVEVSAICLIWRPE